MEKKKLLIVAVSVGVVLLIMIGVPLLVINKQPAATPASHAAYNGRNATERFGVPPTTEQLVQPEGLLVADALGDVDNLNLPSRVTIPVPTPQPPAGAETPAAAPVNAAAPAVTITVQPPKTVAVPDTAPAIRPAPARPAATAPAARPTPPPAVAAQPARPAPAPAAPAARPAAPAAKPATPAARPAAPATATRSNFWVQTGAFSSNARAESVKESLEAKGIISIIENRNIDGKTLYRVRVGPYLSETEANYWLALVRSIDGFADSQVRVSQVPISN